MQTFDRPYLGWSPPLFLLARSHVGKIESGLLTLPYQRSVEAPSELAFEHGPVRKGDVYFLSLTTRPQYLHRTLSGGGSDNFSHSKLIAEQGVQAF